MNKLCTVLLVALVLCSSAGFAQNTAKKKGQDQSRSVQGTVSASDDSAIKGARVYLENTKSLQVRTFYTQQDGGYVFHDLSPDVDYKLRAEFEGATSGTKTLSSFDSRKEAVLNLKLNPKK
jgi:hypothetical protein